MHVLVMKLEVHIREKNHIFQQEKHSEKTLTLFAQKSPQALQSDLGPDGPRRIIGVDLELIPQCVQLF